MTPKMIILNLVPLAVMIGAIFLFVEPEERPILIAAAMSFSLAWALIMYSFTFTTGIAIILKRKIGALFRRKE